MEHVDLTAIARMGLIFAHVLAFSAAFTAVAFSVFAIFHQHRVDSRLLARASQLTLWLLAALWITGLAVTWLDTRFDPAVLTTKPQLLAKLSVVSVLTLNGVLLHAWAFPRIAVPQPSPPLAATLAATLGAISATALVYAAFIGVAKAAAPVLGYAGFMALFAALVLLGSVVSLVLVRPRLTGKFVYASGTAQRAPKTVPRPSKSSPKAKVFQFTRGPVLGQPGRGANGLARGGLAPLGPQPAD